MPDPVADLAHDHAELNRRVLALGAQLRAHDAGASAALLPSLRELRDLLFLHFAREEEGLFPFVHGSVAALAEQVQVMEVAHDTICGALARMVHLATAGGDVAAIASLFDRFENAYAAHAQAEAELLQALAARLDGEQRRRLASLVAGL